MRRTTRIRRPGRIVAGLVVLAFLASWVGVLLGGERWFGIGRGSGYEVSAVFEQVTGLPEGGEIRAGGVVVGRVERITLEGPDRRPRVRMRIDEDFRLRRGAVADLRLFSNSGQLNRYVALHQGDGPALRDGATLGLGFTDQPVEVDEVLRVLDGPTRDAVRETLGALDGITEGRGPAIAQATRDAGPAFEEVARLAAEIDADGAALKTALRDGRRVVGAIAEDPAQLGRTADELGRVLAATAPRRHELAAATAGAAAGLREPRRALEQLDAAIPDLRRLIGPARAAVAELPATIRDTRPALEALRPALRDAAALARTAPRDLRRLTPLLRTAGPLLTPVAHTLCQTGPILDTLRAAAPDVLGGLIGTASAVASYDANGHVLRTTAAVSRILGGIAEPDQNHSGLLREPFVRVPGTLVEQPWRDFRKSFIGGDGTCG